MRYLQCLLKHKKYYQLRWLPERYAHVDAELKIKGCWGESWMVKEVYRDWFERVVDSGKVVWYTEMSPYLEGDKLQERLKLNKKMTKFDQIEEI